MVFLQNSRQVSGLVCQVRGPAAETAGGVHRVDPSSRNRCSAQNADRPRISRRTTVTSRYSEQWMAANAKLEIQTGKGGEGPDADHHRGDEHHVDDFQRAASQDVTGDQGDQLPMIVNWRMVG